MGKNCISIDINSAMVATATLLCVGVRYIVCSVCDLLRNFRIRISGTKWGRCQNLYRLSYPWVCMCCLLNNAGMMTGDQVS